MCKTDFSVFTISF